MTVGSGSSAVTIAPDPSSPGQVVASSAGGVTTLSAGQQDTVGGQSVSVGSSGQVVVPVTSTIDNAALDGFSTTADGRTISAGSGSLVVDDETTLTAGDAATTIAGTAFSVNNDGQLVVQGQTTFSPAAASQNFATIFQGQTISSVSGGIVINGQTLTNGASPTTIAGVEYSAGSNGELVVADSTTMGGSSGFIGTTIVNGEVISSVSNGVVVDGRTLTAGEAATTIDGEVYSVNSNGQLVVASSTTLGGAEVQMNGLLGAMMSLAAGETGNAASEAPPSATATTTGATQAASNSLPAQQTDGAVKLDTGALLLYVATVVVTLLYV